MEGEVNRQKTGEKTTTGAEKETFGSGRAAQSEAGKKGGQIAKERGAGIMADPQGYGKQGGSKGGRARGTKGEEEEYEEEEE